MSNLWLRRAWQVELPAGPKFTLIALADSANAEGVCWPSGDRLAEMTGVTAQTISDHIGVLVSEGFITRKRARRGAATTTLVASRFNQDFGNQEFLNQEIGNPEVKAVSPDEDTETSTRDGEETQDFGNQEFGISGAKTSGIPKSLKRTLNEPITSDSPEAADDEPSETEPEEAKCPPEGVRLCNLLADRIAGNGSKRPTVGKTWFKNARLLLTTDERPYAEAVSLIEWSQQHHFWHTTILSMNKFRAQYDQLRLKAVTDGALTKRAGPPISDVDEWLREQWRSSAVGAIERATGLSYDPPNLPLTVRTDDEREQFQRQHRRDWITAHHDQIKTILTKAA